MGIGESHIGSKNEQPNKTTVAPVLPNTTVFPETLSDLYQACRQNRIEDVKYLLQTATLADINRMEPLKSTALHAAAFYGHKEIVKLLLYRGAARTIRNSYGYTPYEEATTVEIKSLFERTPDASRFDGHCASTEWMIVDPVASHNAWKYKKNEVIWFTEVCSGSDEIYAVDIKRYINTKLAHIDGIDAIRYFIDQASQNNSVESILKAYTAETGFYNALNVELASINTVSFTKNDNEAIRDEYFRYWHGPGGYAAMIAHHPYFKKYLFTGTAYRGMRMTKEEISTYKVKTLVMNKAFLSASLEQKIATKFALKPSQCHHVNRQLIKYPILCQYEIRNSGTALYIAEISEYPNEKEVLITPRAAFCVASIRKRVWIGDRFMPKIKLRECDPDNNIDSTDSNEFDDDPH